MPHSFGYRGRTRDMFKRGFKEAGQIRISTFLRTYRVGDIVDIKANGAQQKGMPHKYYHGYVNWCISFFWLPGLTCLIFGAQSNWDRLQRRPSRRGCDRIQGCR